MAENSMKPRIRFKGYTDAWEQRKLCSIATKVIEKNENTRIVETFTNSAEFGIISQRDYFDHDISNFDNLSGYYVVQNNDFVYNPRISVTAPVGPINRNKLGRKGVMSPLYMVFRASNIDFTFMEWYFKSEHWHGFMKFNGDSGARSDRFSIKDEIMFQMPLPYPNIHEQELVGEILLKIDNLITLHQRKYDKIVNIKKALLEKMFPSDAETTPKIRFKGFTDAWEQRKLREVFDYERPDTYIVKSDKYSDTYSTPVLTANKGFILGYTNEMQVCNKECIIFDDFTLDSKYVTFPFMVKSSALKILTAKIGYFLPFAYQLLQATNIEILGHARHYISVVQPTKVLIPSNDEQIRIGKCIQQIDNLITLHQRQLEKLKNIKSALLEKMFV